MQALHCGGGAGLSCVIAAGNPAKYLEGGEVKVPPSTLWLEYGKVMASAVGEEKWVYVNIGGELSVGPLWATMTGGVSQVWAL